MPEQPKTPEQHSLLRSGRRFFTPKEMADITDMSISWVYGEIQAGRIKAVRPTRSRIKIPRAEAEAWDEKMRTPKDPSAS